MPLRRSSIVLGAIGAALIISALLVELVAVPILTRLPRQPRREAALHRHLEVGSTPKRCKAATRRTCSSRDVPTTIDRHIMAVSTTAHTAVVTDDTNLSVAGNTFLQKPHLRPGPEVLADRPGAERHRGRVVDRVPGGRVPAEAETAATPTPCTTPPPSSASR